MKLQEVWISCLNMFSTPNPTFDFDMGNEQINPLVPAGLLMYNLLVDKRRQGDKNCSKESLLLAFDNNFCPIKLCLTKYMPSKVNSHFWVFLGQLDKPRPGLRLYTNAKLKGCSSI